jgi:hypothetical protein
MSVKDTRNEVAEVCKASDKKERRKKQIQMCKARRMMREPDLVRAAAARQKRSYRERNPEYVSRDTNRKRKVRHVEGIRRMKARCKKQVEEIKKFVFRKLIC